MTTVSLLHLDGSDAATTTTDELGLTWTFDGGAELDTAQAKFGASSLRCNQFSGDSISCSDVSLKIGTGDFTIEGWVRPYASRASGVIFKAGSYDNLNLYLDSLKVRYFDPEVGYDTTSLYDDGPTLSTDVWYHFAVTRESGTVRAFIDGVKWGEETGTHDDTETPFRWGAYSSISGRCEAWLDELRITTGEAIYTANFTPPSAPFTLPGADLGAAIAVPVALGAPLAALERFYAAIAVPFTLTVDPEPRVVTTDTLQVSDALNEPLVTLQITDTLQVSDTLNEPLVTLQTTDALAVSDSPTGVLAISVSLEDILEVSDWLNAYQHAPLEDILEVSDSSNVHQTASLIDTLQVSDAATGVLAATLSMVDILKVSDALAGALRLPLEDILEVSDTLGAAGFHQQAPGEDILEVSDTLNAAVFHQQAPLTDTLVLSDTLAGQLALIGLLHDVLQVSDTLWQHNQQVLIINAQTGASSEYQLTTTVQGIGEFDGTLYLATDQGLYALDAADDNGTPIAWECRTGFSHLGSEKLKRIHDANTLLRASADTALIVVVNREGTKQEHQYKLVTASREAVRDGVTKVGKGLSSVYWQFGYKGINEAEVDEIRLYPEVLTRRR